jgi:hypothetical protein
MLGEIALTLLSAVFFSPMTSFAIEYQAGAVVVGKSYNEILRTWVKRDFSLWVYVNDGGKEWVEMKGDSGLGQVQVDMFYEKEGIDHLRRMLTTAIEWTDIARSNRADTSKALGCLPLAEYVCDNPGVPDGVNQMGLSFWSTANGQRSSLIADMIHHNNKFKRAEIYFDAAQIPSLINNLEQLEPAITKARETRKKQHLFTLPDDQKTKR